ncbi:MAG TPA: FtsX-like permease family protein, partial [Bryobacteraceae bacterium]
AVLGLMLMACVNLANAQLGRGLTRSRDGAVRTALGASRWRLVWSAIAENLLLAGSGGACGVLLAYASLNLFRRSAPIDLPRLAEVHLNLTVLLFSIVLTSAATAFSGILPALRTIASDPHAALQQNSGRSLGSRRGNRLRRLLVGVQVCGCTALLLITGLFSKSLFHLLSEDRGFDTGQVTVAEVRLAPQVYAKDQSRVSFYDAVLENLRTIPGVDGAALVSAMPLDGESWIESVQRMDRPTLETPLINFRWVGPGYFETTRQKLVAGRFLEERDRNINGVVLTESEAAALWGSENAIGGGVRIEGRIFTVVGVVVDSHSTSLKTPPARMAYAHYKDRPPFTAFFTLRAAQPAEALAPAIREAIWKRDPGAVVARVKTLDAQVADSLSTERFQTSLMLAFGSAALLLALLGIYGVLSCSVAARKQEIGVRIALGASRGSVYGLTFGEVGAPVGVGIAAGLAVSILVARVVRNALYGVRLVDPTVIAAVIILFLLSAALAAYIPARRAASVDPMEALRAE